MLPKIYRLHLKKDITLVLKKGRRFSGKFTTLFCFSNGKNISRFGFVVSKKISKKTTRRNLIKRRLRSVVYKSLPKARKGYDYLFLAKPAALNKKYSELENEVLVLLAKKLN